MAKQTASSLHAWARTANRRDSIVYHTGRIASDREYDSAIDRLAWAAEQLARDGVVNIVHLRRGPSVYDYIAQRTRAPHTHRAYDEAVRKRDADARFTPAGRAA